MFKKKNTETLLSEVGKEIKEAYKNASGCQESWMMRERWNTTT